MSRAARQRAYPHASAYAAAKAAISSFTKSLAETAEHGIAVFAISPGFVWTEMTERLRDSPWFPDFGSPNPGTNQSARASSFCGWTSGELDALSGRYIHVRDDIDQMLNE